MEWNRYSCRSPCFNCCCHFDLLVPCVSLPLGLALRWLGIIVGFVVTNIVSLFTRPSGRMLEWQKRLDERTHDTDWYTPTARRWQKFLAFYIPFWWLMFVGPGIELGHYLDGVLFGAPGLWFWMTKVTPEPLDEEGRRTITER
ncbi:hypothetical protein M1N18_01115 [Dehalococcoidales bacterium]|nr:hypothetical protein [Dehalococcoidales bacterium]